MNCIFVDYQIETGKWRKQWADLGVPGKVVSVADFAAAINDATLPITLVVVHAANEKDWDTVRDETKRMHAAGSRYFLLRVAADALTFQVSENALRCRSAVSFVSGGSLVGMRSRFASLVEALDKEQNKADWGTNEWQRRVLAIWTRWEGQSAVPTSGEVAGDDWTVAAALKILAEGFSVATSLAKVNPSIINARRDQAVRSQRYWLNPFYAPPPDRDAKPSELIEKAIERVAGSFSASQAATLNGIIGRITADAANQTHQEAAVSELEVWLRNNYQLR